MIVRPVGPLGARCCDHYGPVSGPQAVAIAKDFGVIFLYCEVVTAADLAFTLGAGLCVGFILEGLSQGMGPSAELGQSMARAASLRMRDLGVPSGVTIFSDLENPGHKPSEWIAFADGAADETHASGDIAGHYIGDGLGLTSGQLYGLHGVRYGKGASRIVDANGYLAEPACSWCWVQGYPTDITHPGSGLSIDIGTVWHDYRGRTVSVLAGD